MEWENDWKVPLKSSIDIRSSLKGIGTAQFRFFSEKNGNLILIKFSYFSKEF